MSFDFGTPATTGPGKRDGPNCQSVDGPVDDAAHESRIWRRLPTVDVETLVLRAGGAVTRAQLLHWLGRAAADDALASGALVRRGRGRYVARGLDEHRAAAHGLSGTLVLASAALARGWAVARPPGRPQVAVSRHRKIDARRRRGVELKFWDVPSDGLVTPPERTVIDCARFLPFLDAVCVADSALRSGEVTSHGLLQAAEAAPRTGRRAALAVVAEADGRADNPFESATRVLSRRVGDIHLVPQQMVPGVGRVDLADPTSGLVVECDSFAFHAHRAGLLRDIERYNALELTGRPFLRVGWEHAFRQPDYVVTTMQALVDGLAVRSHCSRCAA